MRKLVILIHFMNGTKGYYIENEGKKITTTGNWKDAWSTPIDK